MWNQDVLDSRNLYFILSNIIKSHVPIQDLLFFLIRVPTRQVMDRERSILSGWLSSNKLNLLKPRSQAKILIVISSHSIKKQCQWLYCVFLSIQQYANEIIQYNQCILLKGCMVLKLEKMHLSLILFWFL